MMNGHESTGSGNKAQLGQLFKARLLADSSEFEGQVDTEKLDRAIAEIHLALESNPDHHALRFLLAEAYRSEAELLERLEWWLQERPEATS